MKIRALIVDDEEPGRINLRYGLAPHAGWALVAECASAAAARAVLDAQAVDVVFLDIQMPQETGLALARELARRAEPPLVIFATAYNEHAIEAFEVHALDYLLKPFDDQRLAQALERAAAMLEQRQRAAYGRAMRAFAEPAPSWLRQLNVRSVGRIECVQVDEVLWIEAAGNYVELRLAQRRVLHRVPLASLEQHLDPAAFLRVHRRALVRSSEVAALERDADGASQLRLRCGDRVPVSERHLAAVKALLGA
ncbi:LytR/AlgR family response regulator transcription factor [Pseudoduganella violaceinigra]|uniref:LytR/AlgR family response regulator transcription factor n=1 Tax=Pseudoduganella violaceinigra TaxID=246602 RepID=UPI00041EAF5E|nr:LytTR family DNA-binding domain-containing protein [Pseudoduganella violaceinigra]